MRDDHEAYRVCFAGAQPIEKFKEIGFFDHDKMEKINNYLNGVKWDRDAQIPMTSPIKSYLSDVSDAKPWTSSSTIGIGKLEQFASQAEGLSHEDLLRIKKLVNMDIYWDKVEEINEVENEEYVYDISVNPAQNFVGGFGGIFAHNSEENLRKIFEDAEENAPNKIRLEKLVQTTKST